MYAILQWLTTGKALAKRWGYIEPSGRRVPAPGLLATPISLAAFTTVDRFPGVTP